jgi:hypothetical protein
MSASCSTESNECQTARRDYDRAHRNKVKSERIISTMKQARLTGGAIIGIGVALLAIPVAGWAIAGPVMAFGAGFGGGSWIAVEIEKSRCLGFFGEMYDAFNKADDHCEMEHCKPPRPTSGCT